MYYNPIETGKRIGDSRKALALSQEEYSERLNISRNHLARIEIGLRTASIEVLIAVAELSNTTIDYLVMGKETNSQRVKADIRSVVNSLIKIEQEL